LSGILYFRITQNVYRIRDLVLITLGVQEPISTGLYGSFYLFLWPVFIETFIFGFLVNALLERFNPVLTARRLAKGRRNHTIVIGYQHLGIRMISYLKSKHRPFVLIDFKEEVVNALIESGEPVIIGDATETSILKLANVKKAKEVFILVNNVRSSIITSEKVRELNKTCKIYVRLYEQDFSDYLKSPPLNANVFATSNWALDAIRRWSDEMEGGAIVVGKDHLAEQVIKYISTKSTRKLWAMDPNLDEDLTHYMRNLEVLKNSVDRLESFSNYLDLNQISQIFFCWKEDNETSTAVYLAQRLKTNFPHLQIYVRVFDEELAAILNRIGVTTFSTSEFALNRLQQEVDNNSGLRQ
jgi:voltage-gated potassium channel Kch